MLFVDTFFVFVFLPISVFLFYAVGRNRGKIALLSVLAIASGVFYTPQGILPVLLLLCSLSVNLAVAIAVTRISDERLHARRLILASGLAFNLCLLVVFKYTNDLASLAGATGPFLKFAIPAGISFYTCHQAVFLIDAHARKPEVVSFLGQTGRAREKLGVFVKYAAFVAFFPQLVIGPIVYLSEFAPQIARRAFGRLSGLNIAVGVTFIIFGLFKKLCIADEIGAIINPVFDLSGKGQVISTAQAYYAFFGYFVQLYFDFSGYSDIALGIARLFGIILPTNFDSPLRATGIIDFYRRWHITLTRVIARFLFTPLAVVGMRFSMERNMKGWRRRMTTAWIPMVLNFLVIALWHGARETFLLFGLLHGLWYVLESEWRASKAFKTWQSSVAEKVRIAAGQLLTVLPLAGTLALFRSDSIEGFGNLVWRMFHWSAEIKYFTVPDWKLLGVAAAIIYLAPNAQEMMRRYRPGIVTFINPSHTPRWLRLRWRPNLIWGGFLAVLFLMILRKLGQPAPFLYGGF